MKRSLINDYIQALDKRGNTYLAENAAIYFEIAKSKSVLTKIDLAAVLALHRCEISKQILIMLCRDKNYIVRAESVETLAVLNMPDTYEIIKKAAIFDNSYIVRGYAQYGLADLKLKKSLRSDACGTLKDLMPRERLLHNKACISGALYRFGCHEYLDTLFAAYKKTERYQTKCCALGILKDILNEKNKDYIREFAASESSKDNVRAVDEVLKTLLEMCI